MRTILAEIIDEIRSEPLEHERGSELARCPTPCSTPPPAKGQFSAPNELGHRWFTPEYRRYPSNLSHLARVVRDQMRSVAGGASIASERHIQEAIRTHPCNAHFTAAKPMFMPRFGFDRCTGRGNYYGSIYIPFRFGRDESGRHDPSHAFILQDVAPSSRVGLGEAVLANMGAGSFCSKPARPVVGSDDRVQVIDTSRPPHRWICKIVTIFPPDSSGARPARQATGVLVDARRLVTCAHVLDTDIGVPDFIIVIPGFDMHAPARASSVTSKTAPFGAFVVARRAPGGGSNLHVAQKWRGSLDARYDYGVVDLTRTTRLLGTSLPGSPSDAWTTVGPSLATTIVGAASTGSRTATASDVMKLIRREGARADSLVSAGYPGDRPCVQMLARDRVRKTVRPDSAEHNQIQSHLDAIGGMSGAPIWLERARRSGPGRMRTQYVLVGLHTGGFPVRGKQLRHPSSPAEKYLARVTSLCSVITPTVLADLGNTGRMQPA